MPDIVKIDFSKSKEAIETLRSLSVPEVTEMQAEQVPGGIFLRPVTPSLTQMRKTELRQKFIALAEQWSAERGPHSLVRDLVNHPAYREVMTLGTNVIPFILERLDTQLEDCFPALIAITGIDPVPPQSAGKLEEMAPAWQQWGRENGYYPAIF